MSNKHHPYHSALTLLYTLIRKSIKIALSLGLIYLGDYVIKRYNSPVDLVIGLPLFLIGFVFIANSLWTITQMILSPSYLKNNCIFCNKHLK